MAISCSCASAPPALFSHIRDSSRDDNIGSGQGQHSGENSRLVTYNKTLRYVRSVIFDVLCVGE